MDSDSDTVQSKYDTQKKDSSKNKKSKTKSKSSKNSNSDDKIDNTKPRGTKAPKGSLLTQTMAAPTDNKNDDQDEEDDQDKKLLEKRIQDMKNNKLSEHELGTLFEELDGEKDYHTMLEIFIKNPVSIDKYFSMSSGFGKSYNIEDDWDWDLEKFEKTKNDLIKVEHTMKKTRFGKLIAEKLSNIDDKNDDTNNKDDDDESDDDITMDYVDINQSDLKTPVSKAPETKTSNTTVNKAPETKTPNTTVNKAPETKNIITDRSNIDTKHNPSNTTNPSKKNNLDVKGLPYIKTPAEKANEMKEKIKFFEKPAEQNSQRPSIQTSNAKQNNPTRINDSNPNKSDKKNETPPSKVNDIAPKISAQTKNDTKNDTQNNENMKTYVKELYTKTNLKKMGNLIIKYM